MSERTVAPGARRLRLARSAGLRPRSRWLAPAVACLIAAGILDGYGGNLLEAWRDLLHGHVVQGRPPVEALEPLARASASILALGLVAVVVATGVTGALGPVRAAQLGRLQPGPVRTPTTGIVLIGFGLSVALALSLGPAAAGAARAVDASGDGLAKLWQIWMVRGLTTTGAALAVASALELVLARRSIVRALHQSVEEVADERRRDGSGPR